MARAILVSESKSFKSLFYKSMVNKKKDVIRQKYRRNVSILSLFQDTSSGNSGSDQQKTVYDLVEEVSAVNPHEEYQFNELRKIVQRCINRITSEKRRLIIALKLDGLKEHQIASILNINPHTVSSNWGRAKLALQGCIRHYIETIHS